jgi:hypothetical protein
MKNLHMYEQIQDLAAKGKVHAYEVPIKEMRDVDHKKNPGRLTRVTLAPVTIEGVSIADLYHGKRIFLVLVIEREAIEAL